ncbi:MAG: hypothetical protein J6V40_05390 [Clostridia bacterium]|nr:hypothetical protein [Clostridia bacterium]
MWEITLVFDSKDVSDILAFKDMFSKECDELSLYISEAIKQGDYILSIAVVKDNSILTHRVKLEIVKLIIMVTKYEYFINNLFVKRNNYDVCQFIAKVMVSIGSEYEVLCALSKLNQGYICVRSFVRFLLRDVVMGWNKMIKSLNAAFLDISDVELICEFLKYIVAISNFDDVTLFLEVVGDKYMVSSSNNETILVNVLDKATLVITLLNFRPKNIVIRNSSAFDKEVYTFLKYVFNSKISVEV